MGWYRYELLMALQRWDPLYVVSEAIDGLYTHSIDIVNGSYNMYPHLRTF